MTGPFTVGPATPAARVAGLAVAFRREPPARRLARIHAALGLLADGGLDPDGLLVATDPAGTISGAMLAQPLPGNAGLVWPPEADTPEAAEALTGSAVAWLRARGCRFGQALLTPEELPAAAPLLQHGFRHITRLWNLRRPVATEISPPDGLSLVEFDAENRATFVQTLLATHTGTRDCPELNGIRTADEVLAGHRAAGYAPGRWWLACAAGEPVGVLLLGDGPTAADRELAYVGVVPSARGRGTGRALVTRALTLAAAEGAAAVTLAVDARNDPAARLYRGLGFRPFDAREVLLAVWE